MTQTCNNRSKQQASKKINNSFRPLGNRVLVRRLDTEEKLKGGIILPDTAKKKQEQAEVIAIGTGKKDKNGNTHPYPCQSRRYHPHGKIFRTRSHTQR